MSQTTPASEGAMEHHWKLSLADRRYLQTLYSPKKADAYIEIVELRNQGKTFRYIAGYKGIGVSSVHIAYKNATKALSALQAYPIALRSIQGLLDEAKALGVTEGRERERQRIHELLAQKAVGREVKDRLLIVEIMEALAPPQEEYENS